MKQNSNKINTEIQCFKCYITLAFVIKFYKNDKQVQL